MARTITCTVESVSCGSRQWLRHLLSLVLSLGYSSGQVVLPDNVLKSGTLADQAMRADAKSPPLCFPPQSRDAMMVQLEGSTIQYKFRLGRGYWSSAWLMSEAIRIILTEQMGFAVDYPLPVTRSSAETVRQLLGCSSEHLECTAEEFEAGLWEDPPPLWASGEVWPTHLHRGTRYARQQSRVTEDNLQSGYVGYLSSPGLRAFDRSFVAARSQNIILDYWSALLNPLTKDCCFSNFVDVDAIIKNMSDHQGSGLPSCRFVNDSHECLDDGWIKFGTCRHNAATCIPVLLANPEWNLLAWCNTAAEYALPFAITALGWDNEVKIVQALHDLGHNVLFYWWEPDNAFSNLNVTQVLFRDAMLTVPQTQLLSKVNWHGVEKLDYASSSLRDRSAGEDFKQFFKTVVFSNSDMRTFMDTFNRTDESAFALACQWLRNNTGVWQSWLPSGYACNEDHQCNLCPPGTSVSEARDKCESCAAGRFQQSHGERTCEACPVGTHAPDNGSSGCVGCLPGRFAENPGAATCQLCPVGRFSNAFGSSVCISCALCTFSTATSRSTSCPTCPSQIEEDEQHEVYIAGLVVLVVFFAVAAALLTWRYKRCRQDKFDTLWQRFETALADDDDLCAMELERQLSSFNVRTPMKLKHDVDELRRFYTKKHSEEAGISVAYLLSEELLAIAQKLTGLDDPTFYEMKECFYIGEHAIGRHNICRRDGIPGCAFVDTLPLQHRRQCTHFLSWTWSYRISTVRSALRNWVRQQEILPDETFLFMCFFCVNQYRVFQHTEIQEIPVVRSLFTHVNSLSLIDVFEHRLMRIGKLVALLDTWEEPIYLRRIWTIFEQYTAAKLGLSVSMILPPVSARSLIEEFEKGKLGIMNVKSALGKVEARHAQATYERDEIRVKGMIAESIGFDAVNTKVKHSMLDWVAGQVLAHMKELVGPCGDCCAPKAGHICTELQEMSVSSISP